MEVLPRGIKILSSLLLPVPLILLSSCFLLGFPELGVALKPVRAVKVIFVTPLREGVGGSLSEKSHIREIIKPIRTVRCRMSFYREI